MQIKTRIRKCPRLSHKKSKTGCQQCRGRRVKCDEVHPVCGPCSRHNAKCYYDRMPTIPNDQLPKEGKKRRLMEINLVHHYVIETSLTFPSCLEEQFSTWPENIWNSQVIELAMEYEPLLHIIMAITILHVDATGVEGLNLMDDVPKLRNGYITAMENEHFASIADMKCLIGTGNNRADAAAFTSVLFLYDAFASMRYRQKDLSPYQAPIYWLQTCKNLRQVLREAVEFKKPNSIINAAVWSSALVEEPCAVFCEANRSKFPYLREIRSDEAFNEADYESCLTVLGCVGALKCALDMDMNIQVLCRKLMDLPALFPSCFIGLLKVGKPRALAILAHYFAIASVCHSSWIIGNIPEQEVRAIVEHLGPDWQREMKWPLEVIKYHYRPVMHTTTNSCAPPYCPSPVLNENDHYQNLPIRTVDYSASEQRGVTVPGNLSHHEQMARPLAPRNCENSPPF